MRKFVSVLLVAGLLAAMPGCFSGNGFRPADSECMYRCSKCGKRVLMLNSVLRSEACPEGGSHQWQYNVR